MTDDHGNQRNLGYVMKCEELHIYHAGDTVVTQKLIEDVRACGPIAVACVPVNGVDTERHSRGIIGNMDWPRRGVFRPADPSRYDAADAHGHGNAE